MPGQLETGKGLLEGLRPFREEDIGALTALISVGRAWPPGYKLAPEDLRARWQRWRQRPEHDISVLPAPDGGLAAYLLAAVRDESPSRLVMELIVHPDFRRQGIGSALIHLAEQRARSAQISYLTCPVVVPASGALPEGLLFAEHHGFFPDRSYWEMRLYGLSGQPAPRWPEGFYFRHFNDVTTDAEIWASLVRRAFFENITGPKVIEQMAEPGSSPDGYLFAVDTSTGLEIGTSRGRLDVAGPNKAGYVGTVGVLPEFRRRGIAQALLLETIAYLRAGGVDEAFLYVENANAGAKQLYERMGWVPVLRTVHFWKTLRRQ